MKKVENPQFIVIISCITKVENNNEITSSAIIFNTFDDALRYARNDAMWYKHLASEYIEHVGNNKRHADIKLHGKYINKAYRISDLNYGHPTQDNELFYNHLNTYSSFDYYKGGMLL